MQVVYERCGGRDVHQWLVVACVLIPGTGTSGRPRKEIRSFGAMSDDLERLAEWLTQHGVTHVAMESTGVFWQPIWNVLEGRFSLLLVNAQHIKAVPGRKTDVRGCEWIAELLRHGLLKPSFVPERAQRELRELTRHRTSLLQERAAAINRLQKTLEGANIKLAAVASNVVGVSARQILEQLLAGERDTAALAHLARGKLRAKRRDLERALAGQVGPHQCFLIAQHLAHIDFLDEAVAHVSVEIEERTRPFEEALARLDAIPGVGRRTAEILIAEIGTDMSRFPTAGHLASWAGLCPGQHESAGKRRSGRTRKGNPWLRTALVEAAQAAAHTKNTYLAAQYHRLAGRRGRKRAILAVGHTILVTAYHLLDRADTYRDLGPLYFEERDRRAVERRLVRRLERLGYQVTLTPPAA